MYVHQAPNIQGPTILLMHWNCEHSLFASLITFAFALNVHGFFNSLSTITVSSIEHCDQVNFVCFRNNTSASKCGCKIKQPWLDKCCMCKKLKKKTSWFTLIQASIYIYLLKDCMEVWMCQFCLLFNQNYKSPQTVQLQRGICCTHVLGVSYVENGFSFNFELLNLDLS